MPNDIVQRLLLLSALLAATTGCDSFPGYRVWVSNASGEDRILVLTQSGSLSEGQLPTYMIRSDGVLRQTEFVVTAAPPDPVSAGVFVYDSSCALLVSLSISKVGGYLLKIEAADQPSLELLDDASLPTGAEQMTSVDGGCKT